MWWICDFIIISNTELGKRLENTLKYRRRVIVGRYFPKTGGQCWVHWSEAIISKNVQSAPRMNEEGILEDRVNNREFDVNDFSYSTTKLLVLIPIASNPGVPKPQPSPNDLMIHCTCASLPEDAGVS